MAHLIFAVVSLAAYGGLVNLHLQHGTLRAQITPITLAWLGLACAAYAASLLWAERRRAPTAALILGTGLIFRMTLWFTVPTLSDDVYRYLWDGYLTNQGVSPYALPIDSPQLDYLDIPMRAQANNRWMASPYLPAAQFVFAGLTRLFPLTPLTLQIAMVIFDLGNGLLLLKLLRLAGLPDRRLLLYFWNPLVVMSVGHGAHVDAWMTLLTLLAIWLALARHSARLAPVTLALATLTKILPILLLPVLFWRWRWHPLMIFGLAIGTILTAAAGPAGWGLSGPLDGTGLFGAIRIYAEQWKFNSGLFHWLGASLLPGWGIANPTQIARQIVGLGLLGMLVVIGWHSRSRQSPRALLRLMAGPLLAYLLLTPTLHPWYALLPLVFVPFLAPAEQGSPRRWLAVLPWLYLSAALPLSYLTYLNPLDFRELAWVRWVEWLPTLILLTGWGLVELKGGFLQPKN